MREQATFAREVTAALVDNAVKRQVDHVIRAWRTDFKKLPNTPDWTCCDESQLQDPGLAREICALAYETRERLVQKKRKRAEERGERGIQYGLGLGWEELKVEEVVAFAAQPRNSELIGSKRVRRMLCDQWKEVETLEVDEDGGGPLAPKWIPAEGAPVNHDRRASQVQRRDKMGYTRLLPPIETPVSERPGRSEFLLYRRSNGPVCAQHNGRTRWSIWATLARRERSARWSIAPALTSITSFQSCSHETRCHSAAAKSIESSAALTYRYRGLLVQRREREDVDGRVVGPRSDGVGVWSLAEMWGQASMNRDVRCSLPLVQALSHEICSPRSQPTIRQSA